MKNDQKGFYLPRFHTVFLPLKIGEYLSWNVPSSHLACIAKAPAPHIHALLRFHLPRVVTKARLPEDFATILCKSLETRLPFHVHASEFLDDMGFSLYGLPPQ